MTRARNSANLASHGNLFVDIANDRTGIGSVAPAQNLHVAGTAGFHADVTFTGDNYNATWDRSDNSLKFVDNAVIKLGNNNDLSFAHDGTASRIQDSYGALFIGSNLIELKTANLGEIYLNCTANGAVSLRHNNVTKFETTAYGTNTTGTAVNDGLVVAGVATVTTMNVTGVLTYDDVTSVDSVGIITAREGVIIPDNKALSLGNRVVGSTAGDLRIYHDGSNSYIDEIGSGNLFIRNGTDTAIFCQTDGAVKLYNNGTERLATTHNSVNITGNLNVSQSIGFQSQLQCNGDVHFNGDNYNILFDKSDSTFEFADNAKLRIGDGNHFQIFHDGTDTRFTNNSNQNIIKITASEDIELHKDTGIAENLFHIGDTNTKIRFPAADTFSVETGGNESFRIDSIGRLLHGTTSSLIQDYRYRAQIQRTGSNALDSGILGLYFTGSSGASAQNTPTAIGFHKKESDGSALSGGIGILRFNGHDGSNYVEAATIEARVDGNAGTNDMPGRITFSTTADGASSPTERLRIDSSGRVMIGTTTEGYASADDLTVATSGSTGITIRSGTGNLGTVAYSDGTSGDAEYRGYLQYDHNGDFLKIGTAGAEKIRIDSVGRLLVNRTSTYASSSERLSVNGMTSIQGSSTSTAPLYVFNTESTADGTVQPFFFLHDGSGIRGGLGLQYSTSNFIINGQNVIQFRTGSSGVGGTEKMRLTSAGDLGVGNDSPNCRLAVKDVAEHTSYANVTPSVGDCMVQLYNNPPNETANDHATIQFGVNGGSHNRVNTISAVAESAGNRKMAFTFCTDEAGSRKEKMRITGDGNVGIGTNTIYSKLQVQDGGIGLRGAATPNINFSPTDGNSGNADISYDGNDLKIISNSSGADIRIAAYSKDNHIVIRPNGRVGIRTDNPVYDLDIKVDGGASAGVRAPSGNANFFLLSATNSVCKIGMTPSGVAEYKLEAGNNYFRIRYNNTERFKINGTTGNALFGGTGVSQTNRQLVVGSDAEANLAIETHNTSASETANIRFYRSRGTAASPTTLVDGDMVSQLLFYGHDGTDYSNTAARIRVHCSSTVANNSVPSSLTFATFRASTTVCTEALRLTHMQDLTMGNGSGYSIWRGSANDQFCRYQFRQTTGDNRGFALLEERGDSNCVDLFISKSRGGSGKGVITSGDNLGTIKFSGADGTRQHNGAGIVAWTSGTIATGRIPTNLSFYTHPDSAGQFVERLRMQSVGRILIGNHMNDRGAQFQYEGSEHVGMGIHRNTASHGAPAFVLSASRGTSAGSNTIVQNNDYLGLIRFAGTDGTNSLAAGAQITGIVDGTPGANDMPTRLGFWTSANGSDSPTIRMTVTHEGQVAIGNEGADQTDVNLLVYGRADNTDIATFSGGDYTRGLKISTSANGGLNDQNVIYAAQGDNGQHIFKTGGNIVGRLEHDQSGFISENTANGDGDDECAAALQNDYSSWAVIYKNDWIGGNQGWGTFWAGNGGAAYRRSSSDNNPNEHVMVGSGNKRFTFDLDSGGHAYFDGTLSQNNYDYAEYFEWEDGNPSNEDRRGYSVFVNSNGKIEKATDSTNTSDIIGVISGTAAVLGDGAIYDWQGKWKVDEWGTLVTEVVKQVSWKDDEGKRHSYDLDKVPSGITIPSHASYRQHKRRILNPNYDESKEYIPRDMRQEWDPVGLLGKVRVRDDSPKNPNWKFIKTINGKKLWLIR